MCQLSVHVPGMLAVLNRETRKTTDDFFQNGLISMKSVHQYLSSTFQSISQQKTNQTSSSNLQFAPLMSNVNNK